MKSRGFTLVELAVVIAIIGFLSGIILFSASMYINKGKDSNIAANLAILIPAGETYYNVMGNSYRDFCNPDSSSVLKNTLLQMPQNPAGGCYGGDIDDPSDWTSTSNPFGVCCYVDSVNYNAWAACAKEFSAANTAFCVDSRGIKKEIDTTLNPCNAETVMTQCP